MSLGTQCGRAIEAFLKDPPKEHGGVFTEIDVVRKAALKEWSAETFKEAMKEANQVCGQRYRARKLCRYGPVELPDGTRDYARIASKIVYGAAEGPDEWETPNGTFPKMMIENDELVAQGRKQRTNRNDLVSWDEQVLTSERAKVNGKSYPHEITVLSEIAELRKRLDEIEDRFKARV